VPLAHEATRTPPSAARGRSNVVVFAKRATKPDEAGGGARSLGHGCVRC
jgi:hypothetical protein